jgi:outer membrane protein, multidrug efflux system
MKKKIISKTLAFILLFVFITSCKIEQQPRKERTAVPTAFLKSTDTTSVAKVNWETYFDDPNLIALIDTALINNQELNMVMQEIAISKNEIRARKGEYLPFVGLQAGAGIDKVGRYTRSGSVEQNLEIKPGTEFPEPLSDFMVGAVASWEVDIWKKLRNSKKAATLRYLATVEGKNFMVTNLIAEVASSYYELMALDNLQDIVQKNIALQTDALSIVKQEKSAAKITQLAVNRFEAQLLNTKNLQYQIQQSIVETENRINFLTGRFPKALPRNATAFNNLKVDSIPSGIPSQLLMNRPDIRQAEQQLAAAKLDVKAARANFYPSLSITAGAGFQSFNTAYLISPKSIMYNLVGDLVAPVINRNAIQAAYASANARQIQEVYRYEQTILNAYVDVVNQLSKVENYSRSFETKSQEVDILMQSVVISNNLFRSARADYLEVLLTQREALESKMDLVEIKLKQLNAKVSIYKALGGGWR